MRVLASCVSLHGREMPSLRLPSDGRLFERLLAVMTGGFHVLDVL